jgi:hypothetical protein
MSYRPGSFIIRHSDSTPGDFALTFRTKDETRHWKIAANQGKYYVHPRPQPYESLDEIVDVSHPITTCTVSSPGSSQPFSTNKVCVERLKEPGDMADMTFTCTCIL